MATPEYAFELKHHHGAVSVPSLDESIAWYGSMLGFQLERRFHIPKIPADVAVLRRGPMRIELFEVPGAAPLPADRREPDSDNRTHGNKHIAFTVRDAGAALERLRERGADIAFMVEASCGVGFFVRDNAGNLIEFVEEPEMWSAAARTAPMPTGS